MPHATAHRDIVANQATAPIAPSQWLTPIAIPSMSTFRVGVVLILLLGAHPPVVAESRVHTPHAAAPHTCVVSTPAEIRPEFGCFRIGAAIDLKFDNPTVFWHLQTYPSRAAADAAKSPSGIVVEEVGRVWLSEFGSRRP